MQFLFGVFADRGEVERGLDVLFERRELFAADDAAGDRLAEVELEKLGRGGAAGARDDEDLCHIEQSLFFERFMIEFLAKHE